MTTAWTGWKSQMFQFVLWERLWSSHFAGMERGSPENPFILAQLTARTSKLVFRTVCVSREESSHHLTLCWLQFSEITWVMCHMVCLGGQELERGLLTRTVRRTGSCRSAKDACPRLAITKQNFTGHLTCRFGFWLTLFYWQLRAARRWSIDSSGITGFSSVSSVLLASRFISYTFNFMYVFNRLHPLFLIKDNMLW